MAGSPSAAWLLEMRKGTVEPVVHCSVALSGTTMDFHNWTSGGLDSTVTGDPLLSEIASVTQQTDPVVRSTQMSEITLALIDDGKIRGLADTQTLYNSLVTIKLGTAGLALSDFVVIFKGPIIRIHPTPGQILLKVADVGSLIYEKKSRRTYYSAHPFEVMQQMLLDSGVVAGDIHTASFTPANYSDDISHYCYSSKQYYTGGESITSDTHWRYDYGGILTVDNSAFLILDCRDFVDETLALTRTSMFIDTDGKVKLQHYNSSNAIVKHFTTDEYSEFSQLEEDVQIYNEIECQMVNNKGQLFTRQDNASITKNAKHPLQIDSSYLSPVTGKVRKQQPGGNPAASDQVLGFCGTRNLVAGVSGDESITADRPCYWMNRAEIFKGTSALTYDAWVAGNQYTTHDRFIDDDGDLTSDFFRGPVQIVLNGMATRPFAGNQADIDNSPTYLYDVTVLYDFAGYVLERFSHSAPTIQFELSLEYAYLEIGDLISIDNDVFLSTELDLNGLDSSVKFEITQKEITPLGSGAGVSVTCVYATQTSPPTRSLVDQMGDRFTFLSPNAAGSCMDYGVMANSVVGGGLELGLGSGLDGTCSAGVGVSGAGWMRQIPSGATFRAIASQDNYVGIEALTGEITVTAGPLGGTEPPLRSNEIRLGKVVAGGSSLSSAVDLRQFGFASVDQIDPLAVAPGLFNLWNNSFDVWNNTAETPPGWDYDLGVILTDFERSSTAHNSVYSLKTLNTATNVRFNSRKFPVDPNKSYDASVYLQTSAAFALRMDVYWYKADRTASTVTASVIVTNANLPSTGAWHQKNSIITPPSDAAYGKFTLFRAASPGGVGYFDDLKFREVPAGFRAKTPSAGGGTSIAKDTDTAIVFTAETHDYGGVYTTSGGSAGRFTAPENGVYEFTYTAQVQCAAAPTIVVGYLLKNGSNIAVSLGAHQSVSPFHASVTVQSGPIELEAGDYVTPSLHIGNQTATLVTAVDDSYFSGRRVQ